MRSKRLEAANSGPRCTSIARQKADVVGRRIEAAIGRDLVITGNEPCRTALTLLKLRVTKTFRRPELPVKWSPDRVKRKNSPDKSSWASFEVMEIGREEKR